MSGYGELLDTGTVRFERLLPGPIERVWSYLVESDKRALWFCGGETELRVGGRIDLHFHNSTLSGRGDIEPPERHRKYQGKVSFTGAVTRCEPPFVLSHTWVFGDEMSEVCYELTEQGDSVLLVLTHSRLESGATVLSVSSGWHTHLDILVALLEGRRPGHFWKTMVELESEYEERLGVQTRNLI